MSKIPKLGRVLAREGNNYVTIEWIDDEGVRRAGEFTLIDYVGPDGRSLSNTNSDILIRLRRHFDQDTCNEDPLDIIDIYEKDRRLAALEIVALRERLAALGDLPAPTPVDPKVVRLRRSY
jgi:hypothetical protein